MPSSRNTTASAATAVKPTTPPGGAPPGPAVAGFNPISTMATASNHHSIASNNKKAETIFARLKKEAKPLADELRKHPSNGPVYRKAKPA